jgi:hypothetical protein
MKQKQSETKLKHGAAFICGGVMSDCSAFFKDIEANMMAFYMPDEIFKEYKEAKEDGRKFMLEYAEKLFKKHARSVI